MASVTARIRTIKQPRGGYIKPSEFGTIILKDDSTLNEEENVHNSIIGMAVDYLTRFLMGTDADEAFKVSLLGATLAERHGVKNATSIAEKLVKSITGLDRKSVINACKLVSFDVWFRNPYSAIMAKEYHAINPDKATVENIQILVKRSVSFFQAVGPITKIGFSFEPESADRDAYVDMLKTGCGTYGGYTATVESGDGDFLTSNTLWDFKVSNSKPTSKHTLQLLMYWIMGQHSGQDVFKSIRNIGIFNPRLNTVYLLPVSDISADIIKTVENEVICY